MMFLGESPVIVEHHMPESLLFGVVLFSEHIGVLRIDGSFIIASVFIKHIKIEFLAESLVVVNPEVVAEHSFYGESLESIYCTSEIV